MAEVDLGNVKGDKLEWADLTDADKTEITPGIYAGNVTTLDAGLNASVTLRKDQNGKINTFDFGIPKGKDGTEITVATFDDTTSTYTTITDANTDAELNLNKIVSGKKVSEIFTNVKRALSGMIQSLKIFNTNVGAIKGITSDLTATDPQYAASITSLSEVNRNLSDSIDTLNNKMVSDINAANKNISNLFSGYDISSNIDTLPPGILWVNGYSPHGGTVPFLEHFMMISHATTSTEKVCTTQVAFSTNGMAYRHRDATNLPWSAWTIR